MGRAAVCDCGTPWTFLLPFMFTVSAPDFRRQLSSAVFSKQADENKITLITLSIGPF